MWALRDLGLSFYETCMSACCLDYCFEAYIEFLLAPQLPVSSQKFCNAVACYTDISHKVGTPNVLLNIFCFSCDLELRRPSYLERSSFDNRMGCSAGLERHDPSVGGFVWEVDASLVYLALSRPILNSVQRLPLC